MGSADPQLTSSFREAMRRVASTVTIITAADGEHHHGMTVTAVSPVSMEPPSLLVCLNNNTRLHGIMGQAPRFCVNILHADQADLSRAFSGAVPGEERFKTGAWKRGEGGLGYLLDAQANVFCETFWNAHDLHRNGRRGHRRGRD